MRGHINHPTRNPSVAHTPTPRDTAQHTARFATRARGHSGSDSPADARPSISASWRPSSFYLLCQERAERWLPHAARPIVPQVFDAPRACGPCFFCIPHRCGAICSDCLAGPLRTCCSTAASIRARSRGFSNPCPLFWKHWPARIHRRSFVVFE